ncbi:hypothetical protein [Paracoccus luteus]|uniref:hypothetical protein n=1 Tax=Paracoccus luteus TaxID=2508543 RepID=UPI001C70013D|nr:hypothetical protein [Paracoccus luteus]
MDVRASSLTGAAGEHLVMSRLLSRGYIAALAPQGVLNFDIVVTSPEGARLCAFQVKTSWEKGSDRGWHMQEKHEALVADSIFYALVDLGKNADATPTVYVVPSEKVADAVRTSHVAWRQKLGKKGQSRNDTKFRRLNLDYTKICGSDFPLKAGWLDPYRENWAQIASFSRPAHEAE